MQSWQLKTERKLNILKQCEIFSALDNSSLRALAEISSPRQQAPGETLFYQDAEASGFFVLVSGTLHVYRTGTDGRHQILHIFNKPGDICGEVPVFEGSTYPAAADAVTDVNVLYLTRSDFLSLARKQPDILLGILAELSRRLRRFVGLIDDLSLKDVYTRLAKYLLLNSGGQSQFTLPSTKASLASQLGTIPETISRLLRRMQKEGTIRVNGRQIKILDRAPLEQTEMA